MHEIIQKSISDTDIDLKRLKKCLIEIEKAIKISNRKNLTDINVICEEIFGMILNKLYNIHLVSMSAEVSGNFIAVDLVDYENRIAYQVTSQDSRNKIDRTIQKFNNSDLYKNISELRILILKTKDHKYREGEKIQLNNGNSFSYKDNIMNFNKLIAEIEKKNSKTSGFLAEIYDCISMVHDSGRLEYHSIVEKTQSLMRTDKIDLGDVRYWAKGYGDVWISAFIPLSYERELSCMLQMRRDLSLGDGYSFNQDSILKDYFVSEEEFKKKHYIGRYEDEEQIYMQLQHGPILVNAHTAYHIYKLFDELKEEYNLARKQIDDILGVGGLKKEGTKYLLMYICTKEWEEILFFARNHDWFKNNEEVEWNIFNNNNSKKSLILSPNVNGNIKGDVLAKISVSPSENEENRLKLYWEPGFNMNARNMDCFDNIIKWKADYTAEWIKGKLLEKAHLYYEKNNCMKFSRGRLLRMKRKK